MGGTFLAMSKKKAKDAANVGGCYPIALTSKSTALLRMGIQISNLVEAQRHVLG
jgi:hypothetical protein